MLSLERIRSFINSFNNDDEGMLASIYKEAIANGVPVIKEDTRELLKVLILMNKPMNILEIGTAVGYSSIYMSQYIAEGANITTIELDSERVSIARENILKLGKNNQINVLEGDALPILKGLSDDESFDMIFVDAAKGQYINYLPEVLRLAKTGGIIISDNVLQDGDVLESKYTVKKRNRTIHERMREYILAIKKNQMLETAILSVGDGVAVSIKKDSNE